MSSSQEQRICEDLQASRPRPKTSNCVLEDKDVLDDFTFDIDSMVKDRSTIKTIKLYGQK